MKKKAYKTVEDVTAFMGRYGNVRLTVDFNRYIYTKDDGATLVLTHFGDGRYDVYMHGPNEAVGQLQEAYERYFAMRRLFGFA